jgi:hypothetical protein
MTDKNKIEIEIDPIDVPLGMYYLPSTTFIVRAQGLFSFNGLYEVVVPQHDAHVQADVYKFSGIEPLIGWIRAFDSRLKEKP